MFAELLDTTLMTSQGSSLFDGGKYYSAQINETINIVLRPFHNPCLFPCPEKVSENQEFSGPIEKDQ